MITYNIIDFGKLVLSAMIGLIAWGCNTKAQPDLRVTENFNFGWKFHHGPVENAYKTDFSDKDWQEIRLPHDWSVTYAFTQENTAGATAFLPGGIGWYRKTFSIPSNAANKITWIEFDGVYSNAEVWINGTYLGKTALWIYPFQI